MTQRKKINFETDFLKHSLHNVVLEQEYFLNPIKGQIRYNPNLDTISWHTGIIEKSFYDIKLNELHLPDNVIDLNNQKIINLSSPENPNDATNKMYVDISISNIPSVGDLSNKVDKVEGKALSTNDFTNTLKVKLDNIQNNATYNPRYLYIQNTDQEIWNINHNLGSKPHIDFYDQDGLLFIAYYHHIDNNNSQVVLNFPSKGIAQCSI